MTGEAHVANLEVVVSVEQDVSAFQVSVGEPFHVHEHDCLEQLLGVEADYFSPEGATVREVVEDFAAGDELLDYEGNWNLARADSAIHSNFFGHDCILFERDVLDDVPVRQLIRRFNLLFEELKLLLVELFIVFAEYLDGKVA